MPEGILVLPEGKFTVKDGQMTPSGGKRVQGSVTVIRRGAGLEQLTLTARYYEESHIAGYQGWVEHETDLAKHVPAAGSVLRVGKGRSWLVSDGSKWIDMSGRQVKKGYELAGGGRVDDTLRALNAAKKISVTADEIDLMQRLSEVESSGYANVINTWDSDVVSLGFMQYTLAGSLQELIAAAPDAFARYGIKLSKTKLKIKSGVEATGIEGVSDAKELRGLEWATRFFRAGLDPDVIAAQVKMAQAEFAKLTKDKLGSVSGDAMFQTGRVKAIIFELNNNRPAYVSATVRKTAAEHKKHPAWTEDDFVAGLQSVMEQEYVDNNGSGLNGANDEEARQKARNIVTKAGHSSRRAGRLSRRGRTGRPSAPGASRPRSRGSSAARWSPARRAAASTRRRPPRRRGRTPPGWPARASCSRRSCGRTGARRPRPRHGWRAARSCGAVGCCGT